MKRAPSFRFVRAEFGKISLLFDCGRASKQQQGQALDSSGPVEPRSSIASWFVYFPHLAVSTVLPGFGGPIENDAAQFGRSSPHFNKVKLEADAHGVSYTNSPNEQGPEVMQFLRRISPTEKAWWSTRA